MVKAISKTLFSAWSDFHLLKGFHTGSKAHPTVAKKFDRLFDQLWRTVFYGLFAKIGTLIDRKTATYSLPNLITKIRKHGGAKRKLLEEVEVRLKSQNGSLVKIQSWRHKVISHCTSEGQADVFFKNNQMNLNEVAEGLKELEELLNILSGEVLQTEFNTETDTLDLVQQGNDLFACVVASKNLRNI